MRPEAMNEESEREVPHAVTARIRRPHTLTVPPTAGQCSGLEKRLFLAPRLQRREIAQCWPAKASRDARNRRCADKRRKTWSYRKVTAQAAVALTSFSVCCF